MACGLVGASPPAAARRWHCPGRRFLCFDQDPLQVDFPIGFLFPGMFGIAPTAPYRAALQADKNGRHAGEKASRKVWNISLIGYCIGFSIWKSKSDYRRFRPGDQTANIVLNFILRAAASISHRQWRLLSRALIFHSRCNLPHRKQHLTNKINIFDIKRRRADVYTSKHKPGASFGHVHPSRLHLRLEGAMTHSTSELNIQQAIDDSKFSLFHWTDHSRIPDPRHRRFRYRRHGLYRPLGRQRLGHRETGSGAGAERRAAGAVARRADRRADLRSHGRKRVLVFSCLFFGLSSWPPPAPSLNSSLTLWRLTGLGLGAAMPNAITLISEYAPQRCRSLAINTMYCGFRAGGRRRCHFIVADPELRLAQRAAARRHRAAVLLILLLPESVKYMVNRGQDAAKIKRIAQRFVSQSLDGVTRFIYTKRSWRRPRPASACCSAALTCSAR